MSSEPAADYRCPISMEVMEDPVVASDGHSYERAYIARWFSAGHRTSPKTNIRLLHTNLLPNHTLRGAIEQWKERARHCTLRNEVRNDMQQNQRLGSIIDDGLAQLQRKILYTLIARKLRGAIEQWKERARQCTARVLRNLVRNDMQLKLSSIIDGLTQVQRKILYTLFQRKLQRENTVAQLASHVREDTDYPYGEHHVHRTILEMAQAFVGSNNLNLLMPIGPFSTRLLNGRNPANNEIRHRWQRRISTSLSTLTRLLFVPDDVPLLEQHLDGNGRKVEPRFYVPILPISLLNGVRSVTLMDGVRCSAPSFNPLEICAAFITRLEKKRKHGGDGGGFSDESFQDLRPYYNGFTGTIEHRSATTWITKGCCRIDRTTVEITELPVGRCNYEQHLLSLRRDKVLKQYSNCCTETTVRFILVFYPHVLETWLNTPSDDQAMTYFEKRLRLTSTISMTKMYLLNAQGEAHKYHTPQDIMEEFYATRIYYYRKRREHQLGTMRQALDTLNKDILDHEKRLGYGCTQPPLCALRKQRKDQQQALEALEGTHFTTMWLNDLRAFRVAYQRSLRQQRQPPPRQPPRRQQPPRQCDSWETLSCYKLEA